MGYQYLPQAIRPRPSQGDWQPPTPDTRYAVASPAMEDVAVLITEERNFFEELATTAKTGLIVGPVLWMRMYQRRDGSPDYAVYFTAVIQLRCSRIELRRYCGDQDLTQDSDSHQASHIAAVLQQRLAEHCQRLEIECRAADYTERQR